MTDGHDLVIAPPTPKTIDYPASIGIGISIIFVAVLLVVSSKFDPSHGSLTISLMVVVAFIGVVSFCMFFTVPQDDTTAAAVGGLTAAFGAVIAYWLGHRGSDPK
jgi:FtsH-binding integral membrane protein